MNKDNGLPKAYRNQRNIILIEKSNNKVFISSKSYIKINAKKIYYYEPK